MLIRSLPDFTPKAELVQAGNGKEGFEKYQEESPDYTFLDLTMPVMDGDEALSEIIKFDSKAKVVVVSENASLHD